MEDEMQLMKMSDVAEAVQVPIRTVYYWQQKGVGPKALLLGRHLRVRRADFEAWLSSRDQ